MAKDSSAKVFRLKWDNHLQNLSCLFESLYIQQKYVDVSLYCDGGTLKAHKVVLSACSVYFEKIFKDHPCKHPVVIVNDIKLKEMQMVLEYMYKGELNVLEDELNSFVSVASLLDVRGLSNNLPKENSVSSEPSLPVSSSNESNGMEIFQCQTDGLEILPVNANNYNDNHNMTGEDDSIMDDRQSTPLSFTDVLQDMLGRQSSMEYSTARTPDNHTQYRQRRSNETLTTSSPENKRVMKVKEEYVAPASPLEILEISENPLNSSKEEAGTEEKTVECSVCKLNFMTPSLLQAHLQDDHNYTEDYRPHRCDFCPLAFYRSAHLKRHRRLHTGEKPFACELCGKSFSRQDKLKQHVTRHGPQVIPVSVPRGRTGRPPRSAMNVRARQTSRPFPMPNRAPFGDVSYLSSMSLASQRSDSISAEQLLRSVQDLGECIIQPCLPNRH